MFPPDCRATQGSCNPPDCSHLNSLNHPEMVRLVLSCLELLKANFLLLLHPIWLLTLYQCQEFLKFNQDTVMKSHFQPVHWRGEILHVLRCQTRLQLFGTVYKLWKYSCNHLGLSGEQSAVTDSLSRSGHQWGLGSEVFILISPLQLI